MIYTAKPQREGRSIPGNANNLPQDPPSPPETHIVKPETKSKVKSVKVSWFRRVVTKVQKIFRRK